MVQCDLNDLKSTLWVLCCVRLCAWIIGLDWCCCYQCYKLKKARALEQQLNSHLELLAAIESKWISTVNLTKQNREAKTILTTNMEREKNNNNKWKHSQKSKLKRLSIKTKQMSESLTFKESILMMVMTAKTRCKEFVHPCVTANSVALFYLSLSLTLFKTNTLFYTENDVVSTEKKRRAEQTISM